MRKSPVRYHIDMADLNIFIGSCLIPISIEGKPKKYHHGMAVSLEDLEDLCRI